ncbi:MAG: hypothetical protein EXR86_05010 [Gammaproteobacteria bacterium]|nr:hypothetical protein [Gammaproteobacteria bacterium]
MADTVVEQLDLRQPRSYGYQIGDKFERTLSLQLRDPYHLAPDALPTHGRVSDWLVLEAPEIIEKDLGGSVLYKIRLTYQVINVDPNRNDIPVPHHFVRYTDGQETLKALVPATRVGVSVLRTGDDDLHPDREPRSLRFRYFKATFYAALLLSALLGVVTLHWGLPTKQRPPFMEAYRRLRNSRHCFSGEDSYREALLSVHHAFNATAGKTVFADALTEFFNKHAQFVSLREPINDFYQRSRTAFYEEPVEHHGEQYSHEELVAFARRCSDIERGLA